MVSIFTESFAEPEPPALSETWQDTGWVPSPETEKVHGPDPLNVTGDPPTVQLGTPAKPAPEASDAVTVSVTGEVTFHPAEPFAVCTAAT